MLKADPDYKFDPNVYMPGVDDLSMGGGRDTPAVIICSMRVGHHQPEVQEIDISAAWRDGVQIRFQNTDISLDSLDEAQALVQILLSLGEWVWESD